MQDFFLGRQPIYDAHLGIYAYELLFRGSDTDHADVSGGDSATSQVVLNAFTEIGLENVVGDSVAFINLTRGFVTGALPLVVPKERVVLEILEDVTAEPEVLAGIRRLKSEGYRIALDDFVVSELNRDLLPLADIVKVDCLGVPVDELRRQVRALRPYGVKLLAEKVETHEQLLACRRLGFHYFQGFFLSRPHVIKSRGIGSNRLALLRLLADLQDPDCSFQSVTNLAAQDVSFSYKLLCYINSASLGLGNEVATVAEAAVILGLERLRQFATLTMLAGLDGKPHALLATAMQRGKMCEGLARATAPALAGAAFTAGLFSTLDALMDCPMEDILAKLPLAPALAAALSNHSGPLGLVLAATLAHERGDFAAAALAGFDRTLVARVFLDAIAWVSEIEADLRHAA